MLDQTDSPVIDSLQAFDETAYLELNPDVSEAVRAGGFKSGYDHWISHGRWEGRPCRSSVPALMAGLKNGISLYRQQVNRIGVVPAAPPTLRGRLGAILVAAVRRGLEWHFQQQRQLAQAFDDLLGRQLKLLEAIEAELTRQSEQSAAGAEVSRAAVESVRSEMGAQIRRQALLKAETDGRIDDIGNVLSSVRQEITATKSLTERQQRELMLSNNTLELFRNHVHDARVFAEHANAVSSSLDTRLENLKKQLEQFGAQLRDLERFEKSRSVTGQ